jgi:hypothetical protein
MKNPDNDPANFRLVHHVHVLKDGTPVVPFEVSPVEALLEDGKETLREACACASKNCATPGGAIVWSCRTGR